MMGHTKGPLRIIGPSQRGDGDYAIVESGDIIIGEAFYRVNEDAYRDAEANARLWASAPKMFEALLDAEFSLVCYCRRLGVKEEENQNLNNVRAAIALAKGVNDD